MSTQRRHPNRALLLGSSASILARYEPLETRRLFASVPLAVFADVTGDGLTDLVSINNIKSKSTHLITFTLARQDGTLGAPVA